MIDLEEHIRKVIQGMDPASPEYPKLLTTLSFVEDQNKREPREGNGPILSEKDARARDLGIYVSRFLSLFPEDARLDRVVPRNSLDLNEEWASLLSPYERLDKIFIVRSLNVARRHGSRAERGQREVYPITRQPLSTFGDAAQFDFLREPIPGAGRPTVFFLTEAFKRESHQLLLPSSFGESYDSSQSLTPEV